MEPRKLTKEDIDKVRGIEGFPIGTDEDIIALSDAPYYTACPNPFIEEFIKENGHPYDEATDDYHCEPFASDVSEGKNDPIYNAHTYHTKVPHKAIMRYILHYTEPGDVVFDGFCGTGMTGVAAQFCGSDDPILKYEMQKNVPSSKWGQRYAVLNDLAPIATFIAKNYSTLHQNSTFLSDIGSALEQCQKKYGWMYETFHTVVKANQLSIDDGAMPIGKINYTVWSDVFICPSCGKEIVFWDVAMDKASGSVKTSFSCPDCGARLKKEDCKHAIDVCYDALLAETHKTNKQVPVLINYSVGKKRFEKKPDEHDLQTIKKIQTMFGNITLPTFPMQNKGGENWGEIWRAGYHFGITHCHHFYTARNYIIVNELWNACKTHKGKWAISAVLNYVNKKQSFTGGGGGMPGVLYIASLVQEKNVFDVVGRKVVSLSKVLDDKVCVPSNIISTGSSSALNTIPDSCIDYIFIDPPFGANIMYSEASFLWECLLHVFSNNEPEAIQSNYQKKALSDYQEIMQKCFSEFNRILKPGRWMTVEFHNSQNAVWNAIQEALQRAGFVVADVRVLDKQQGSFKQVTSQGAVKQDLVISAYKPKESFFKEFKLKAGTPETAWAFVRQHLSNLPITVKKGGQLEVLAERQNYLLWDRMVAYHIMHGIAVPMDAVDFYKGLDDKFYKRDGMYFLPNQIDKYNKVRNTCIDEPIQPTIIITNEKSAIGWLYWQLDENTGNPQTYAELQPKFMQETQALDKKEKLPELVTILEENFLKDKDGKWYIPDYTRSGDIAKLREKNLLKEFAEYQQSKGKLKVFRSEAIRTGFAKLWKDKNYRTIVEMAERLPEETVQEDSNLLMYYDISLSRSEAEPTQLNMNIN